MKLVEYKYNDRRRLSEHFCVYEWKCKCGKPHKIVIADTLPPLLEKVMKKIGAVRGDISSGYRCPAHDKHVGGTGGTVHQGYACDIKFTDKNGKIIPSKTVALALEDLGHKCGIGYKCGGNSNYTHIDVKPRKWYGDESKSMTKSCCSSYYSYFGINKNTSKPNTTTSNSSKSLTLKTGVYGRIGGIGFSKSKVLYKTGTVIKNVTMNVGTSNGYKWLKGYVNNQLRYFPYKTSWYK